MSTEAATWLERKTAHTASDLPWCECGREPEHRRVKNGPRLSCPIKVAEYRKASAWCVKRAKATLPRLAVLHAARKVAGSDAYWRARELNWKRSKNAKGIAPGVLIGTRVINREDYLKRYEEVNGQCEVCHAPDIEMYRLVVDHNHRTGQFRGLCHMLCNRKIVGSSLDGTVDRLRAALFRWPILWSYAEKYEPELLGQAVRRVND